MQRNKKQEHTAKLSRFALGAVAALMLAGSASQVSAQEIGDAKQGGALAERVCAECHAVQSGQTRSPNPKAPSFAGVAATRGMTATALRVWLQSPHPTMPNLLLKDDEKDNVIAYIQSLSNR